MDQGLVFASLKNSKEAIWGLLLFSGYLTLSAPPVLSDILYSCELNPSSTARSMKNESKFEFDTTNY